MSEGWYPERDRYYFGRPPAIERAAWQGDIFRAVPTVLVGHPDVAAALFADEPLPDEIARIPAESEVRQSLAIAGGYAMVLPHPCNFFETEKGAVTRWRTVARVVPVGQLGGRKLVRSGNVVHTIWLPSWRDPADEDAEWAVDLRTITTVDRAYLRRERRVAALSYPAWIALIRRLALYFGRGRLTPAEAAVHAGEFLGDPQRVA
ncbi:hypothetical protein BH23CHL7_BH23CHL7_16550 [soil metagenome]